MSARANDEASIIRAIGQNIDQALQAPKSGFPRVLILMRPSLVGCNICTTVRPSVTAYENIEKLILNGMDILGKSEVDCIKRNEQIFCIVHFLKDADDAWLSANIPGEVFMRHSVMKAHALL
jgi:hypothetical protein